MKLVPKQFSKPLFVFNLVDQYAQTRRQIGDRALPFGDIKFYWTAKIGTDQTRETFANPVELITKQNSGGYFLYFGLVKSANDQPKRFQFDATAVAQEQYLLRIEGHYYEPIEKIMSPTNSPIKIHLQPNANYPYQP